MESSAAAQRYIVYGEDISKMYLWKGARRAVNHQFGDEAVPKPGISLALTPIPRTPSPTSNRGFDTMADDLRRKGLENQVKGAAKEAGGKLRHAAGDLTDDRSQQVRGKAKEMEGKAQRKIGEAQEDLDPDT
jgi:uncharacterized protein YjbJ (UPF0337 family)